jgi:hypothetical protein
MIRSSFSEDFSFRITVKAEARRPLRGDWGRPEEGESSGSGNGERWTD